MEHEEWGISIVPHSSFLIERSENIYMLFAFHSSAAMLISAAVTFLTGMVIMIQGSYFPVGIGLVIVSCIGFIMLLTSVPKLYKATLKRCHYDINGFSREQKNIAGRCAGKKKLDVLINLIFGLMAHEKLDESERLLMQISPLVDKSSNSYKMKYLFLNLALSGKRKDFQNCSYILERLINELQTSRELFILEKDEYRHLAEILQYETAFYSLDFGNLSASDKEIILKLNFLARQYLSYEHCTHELWNEYFKMHFNYMLGITYLTMGDNRSAQFYLNNTANTPYTYPETARAVYFFQTHDRKIFF